MTSLPQEWESFITTIETQFEDMSWTDLRVRIANRRTRGEQAVTLETEQKALVARLGGKKKFKRKPKRNTKPANVRRDKGCYICGSVDHLCRGCPQRKTREEKSYLANAGYDSDSSGSLFNAYMARTDDYGQASDSSFKAWVFDSGCSKHMCRDKTQMFRYTRVEGIPSIRTVNGASLEVEGIGRVMLNLGNTHYLLQDVYHVPSLSDNLFSMGTEMDKGMQFETTG
ncbi:putative integrase catalytic domain-containing protein [Phytophthora infestans]|nr:putative integrase catalytic domain-containing protein [Phytophthora infestans]KAF4142808.1 putative integrase catalytic domain-containing protein [Phytophthora infestans]